MTYPEMGVGHSGTDTSAMAAASFGSRAEIARAAIVQTLQEYGAPLAASELTDLVDFPELTVRPRLSELRNDGLIVDSGIRRPGRYGKLTITWSLR